MVLKFSKSNTYIRLLLLFCLGWIYSEGQSQDTSDTISLVFEKQFLQNIEALQGYQQYCELEYVETDEFSANSSSEVLFKDALPCYSHLNELLNRLNPIQKENLERMFAEKEQLFITEIEALDLPENLKYLAPALSAMNPLAQGENRQAGIWQLQHFQGVLNGLTINDLIDERFNDELSTKAALQQIKHNQGVFGSVELAVVAYLAGNTKLNNALSRVGSNSVIEVINEMPEPVQYKIAAFQAISAFLANHSYQTKMQYQLFDTISFKNQVHFKQITQVLDYTEEELEWLNPQYKYGIIPGGKSEMKVKIPVRKSKDDLAFIDSIYNAYDSAFFHVVAQKIEYPPAPNRQYVGEKVKDLEIEGKTKIKYTLQRGDVLGLIAEDYDVRVADLKYWNNIYNERRIQAGQKINIFVDEDKTDYYLSLQKGNVVKTTTKSNTAQVAKNIPQTSYAIPPSARKVEHKVKSGESPYVIAKKYAGVSPEAILYWNGINDARKIQIGQKLIIYLE